MSRSLERRVERIEERAEAVSTVQWSPLPGPQTLAFESTADVVGFGGSAGGGKTDLAIGKALMRHQRIAFFRRHSTESIALVDRVAELLSTRDGLNSQTGIWRMADKVLEFGSCPNLGDEKKYQGRPKDLLVLDEAANFLEAQFRFLAGWVRSTDPNQRCQTLLCFNPPTTAEGRWIVKYFAPWLDKKHPNPAQPGELRWFAMVDGEETEVSSSEPFTHGQELITPQSRTFIPSRVTDNPHLANTGYMAQLQSLPEPLRSQMLHGDFNAGMEDDPWQVIPTAWVEAAMARWTKLAVKPPMDAVGIDVARGGRDSTIIARRHGRWYDEFLSYPGSTTPDGPTVAGLAVSAMRDGAAIHIDVIGVGSSPYDFLNEMRVNVTGVNVSEKATSTDQSGRLRFFNLRSQLWWKLRELLDPASNNAVALPPDRRLLVDLCAPTWELRGANVYVESRDEIVRRIGRSPDYASALILAAIETPRRPRFDDTQDRPVRRDREYDPYATRERHDPYAAMH